MDSAGSPSGDNDTAITDAFREQGSILMRQGRFADAVLALQRAVASDSNDEVSWRLLGGALASKGDHRTAVPAFEKAVFIAPENARNSYNLGIDLQAIGRDSEARSAFEKSIHINPNDQQARSRIESLNRLAQSPDTPSQNAERGLPLPLQSRGLASIGFSTGRRDGISPAPGRGIPLGFIGNRIAWQNRRFDDVADFKACRRIWMYLAIPLAVLQIGAIVVLFEAAFATAASGPHSLR